MTSSTPFDRSEREIWRGSAEAYARTFARLCARFVPDLLDSVGLPAAPGSVSSGSAPSGAGIAGAGPLLLDVGTGSGSVAAAAAERGARVVVCDAEPGMVALAARRADGFATASDADGRSASTSRSPGTPTPTPTRTLGVAAALPRLPFGDATFDAVTAGFVLNHVGRPSAAAVELRRVVRRGGRVAVTVWASPPEAGQTLVGRAFAAAGVERPAAFPALDPADDFPRTPDGLAALLRAAGLRDVVCARVVRVHRATPDEWWDGPASGVATTGRVLAAQPPRVRALARAAFDDLAAELATEGVLHLPHAALVASGTA